MTKNSLVLIGLFGPTMSSHQPVEGSSLEEHACAEGDNPGKNQYAVRMIRGQCAPCLIGDGRTKKLAAFHCENTI